MHVIGENKLDKARNLGNICHFWLIINEQIRLYLTALEKGQLT